MRALLRLRQAATLLPSLLQKFNCLTRKKTLSRLSYVAVLIVLLALFAFPAFALASGSSKHIDTSNIFSRTPKLLEQEEPKEEVNSKKNEEHAGAQEEKVKEKAVEEKAEKALEKEEAEEKEEEPSWKIPGWQSIFTVLAVVFYGLMLTVLPKIMAKEVEHH